MKSRNFSTGQNTVTHVYKWIDITHVDRESQTFSFASKTITPKFSKEEPLPEWMKYFLPN